MPINKEADMNEECVREEDTSEECVCEEEDTSEECVCEDTSGGASLVGITLFHCKECGWDSVGTTGWASKSCEDCRGIEVMVDVVGPYLVGIGRAYERKYSGWGDDVLAWLLMRGITELFAKMAGQPGLLRRTMQHEAIHYMRQRSVVYLPAYALRQGTRVGLEPVTEDNCRSTRPVMPDESKEMLRELRCSETDAAIIRGRVEGKTYRQIAQQIGRSDAYCIKRLARVASRARMIY